MQTLVELLFKKGGWANPVVVILATIWLTTQIHDLKDSIGQSWTVHMQAEWANQVSQYNRSNWVPNPYVIYWGIKQGSKPVSHQRIQP